MLCGNLKYPSYLFPGFLKKNFSTYMFNRNKYQVTENSIILYPDYGNFKGFTIIGIFSLLFIWALYSVNAKYHNIGDDNILYIIACTVLLIGLGFLTAFKQVVFDTDKQSVQSHYFGFFREEIATFSQILKLEVRSGSFPSAFYIIFKNDPIGNGIRISPTYNNFQQKEYTAFVHNVLPLLRNLLQETTNTIFEEIPGSDLLKKIKLVGNNLYKYVSITKIIFSLFYLVVSVLFIFIAWQVKHVPVWLNIVLNAVGLFCILSSFNNGSAIYINTAEKKLIQSRFFGFTRQHFSFNEVQNIEIVKHYINGIYTYTSLVLITAETPVTIDKSISTAQVSRTLAEVKQLLNLITAPE